VINTHTVGLLTDETGTSAALVSAGPIFGLKLSLEATGRTFGAPPVFRPVHNGSAQLSYFIYSCTARDPNPSPHNSSRHHARVNSRPSVLCIRSTMSNSQRPNLEDQSLRSSPSIFLLSRRGQETGGAERDRTDDLLLAKQALSQLSYGPNSPRPPCLIDLEPIEGSLDRLQALDAFSISPQLSYGPNHWTITRIGSELALKVGGPGKI
jgi:hypothetical protein